MEAAEEKGGTTEENPNDSDTTQDEKKNNSTPVENSNDLVTHQNGEEPETKPPAAVIFKSPSFPIKSLLASKIPAVQPPEKTPVDKKTSLSSENEPSDAAAVKDVRGTDTQTDEQGTKEQASSKPSKDTQAAKKEETLPYNHPEWGCPPATDKKFTFLIMKGGVEIGTMDLEDSMYSFGRLAGCDVKLEHPSISRFHAVLQYGINQSPDVKDKVAKGWHIYDLGSTHGSYRNKDQIPPKQYVRVRVGHMVRFGGSTRLFLLQGPDEDEEAESELTVTELKAKADRRKLAMDKAINPDRYADDADDLDMETKSETAKRSEEGINWGMDYDDIPETDHQDGDEGGEDLDFETLQKREEYYKADPKRALRIFYERTGNEMTFNWEERGNIGAKHSWVCTIELPVDTPSGKPLIAEAVSTGSKRDAQAQCALEACRILDAQGILRSDGNQAGDNVRKRRMEELAENDYYDSDEDTFLDRTGELERKRLRRKERIEGATKSSTGSKALTYDQLLDQMSGLQTQITEKQRALEALNNLSSSSSSSSKDNKDSAQQQQKKKADDPLEAYMQDIRRDDTGAAADSEREQKLRRSRIRLEIIELKTEAARVERMAKIAKPIQLPSASATSQNDNKGGMIKSIDSKDKGKKQMVWIGSMKGRKRTTLTAPSAPSAPSEQTEQPSASKEADKDDNEMEETEDEPIDSTKPLFPIAAAELAAGRHQATTLSDKPPTKKIGVSTSSLHENRESSSATSSAAANAGKSSNGVPPEQPSSKSSNAAASAGSKATGSKTDDLEEEVNNDLLKNDVDNVDTSKTTSTTNTEESSNKAEKLEGGGGGGRKRNRVRDRRPNRGKKQEEKRLAEQYDVNDPDYAVWLPPMDSQTGDGKTSLNEKLGY